MAWNPFKAIGNAIGRVFGREESAAPVPQPERPQAPQEPQERGFFGRLWDRVTSGTERTEHAEQTERERQLEERERQLAERERQVEEREQTLSAAQPQPEPEPELPKFGVGPSDYLDRDERAFGTDSDVVRELEAAVDDFIMDRGGLDGLSVDAREWLEGPTISGPFGEYWQSGGFPADQVLNGMTNISNIEIREGEDGSIDIEFDYEADVDGYEIHGHASA